MFFFRSYFLKPYSILIFCFLLSINFFIPIQTLFGEPNKEVLISSNNATFDQNLGIILLNENVVLKETDDYSWDSILCYSLNQPFVGDSNAKRWELLTTIKWDNTSEIEKELSFFVIQMVF